MEIRTYTSIEEKNVIVAKMESLGLVMLHDDFNLGSTTSGTLTFDYPIPKSAEQLADEAEVVALAKVDVLIDQIDSLAKARVFLKRLCARLIKKGYLP